MQAIISNFKRSRHKPSPNQVILVVEGVTSKDQASKFVGKKLTYKTSSGKEIKGEVRASHGNSGALRALFETGMPGQCLGTKLKLE